MERVEENNLVVLKDVEVPLEAGGRVVANVFLPIGLGPWPVVMSYGPYGKDVHFSQFMPDVWADLQENHPEITDNSSLRHLTFESPDPEVWTRLGYVVIRVDSRGAGKSPGILRPNSPQEFREASEVVQWAGRAEWSNGRVGLLGISYYAAGQWMIAQHRPSHLAAIQPWQGTSDFYRDRTRKGGVFSSGFVEFWWRACVLENQHGNGASRFTDYFTGNVNTGAAVPEEELAATREDYVDDILAHPLEDEWYRSRSADLADIEVPALVGANWGGLQVHLRGTLLGYEGISSPQKFLKIQRGSYFLSFYHPDNIETQRRFFDRHLKGDLSAWEDEPSVEVVVRSMEDGIARTVRSDRWPLPGTVERRLHLSGDGLLTDEPESTETSWSYGDERHAVFSTGPLADALEFCGPIELRLRLASASTDTDLFVALQAFGPDGREAVFEAVGDPTSPVSLGWLRASHSPVDPDRSGFLRPFHRHDVAEPLDPGRPRDLRVEIWPASLSLLRGSELRLTVSDHVFSRDGRISPLYAHDHPMDRPSDVFRGRQTIHAGPGIDAYLALPILKEF